MVSSLSKVSDNIHVSTFFKPDWPGELRRLRSLPPPSVRSTASALPCAFQYCRHLKCTAQPRCKGGNVRVKPALVEVSHTPLSGFSAWHRFKALKQFLSGAAPYHPLAVHHPCLRLRLLAPVLLPNAPDSLRQGYLQVLQNEAFPCLGLSTSSSSGSGGATSAFRCVRACLSPHLLLSLRFLCPVCAPIHCPSFPSPASSFFHLQFIPPPAHKKRLEGTDWIRHIPNFLDDIFSAHFLSLSNPVSPSESFLRISDTNPALPE